MMKPVTCIGRQPNSEVFILGPELQFTSAGVLIEKVVQEYKFIPTLLKQLGALKCASPILNLPTLPADVDALHDAVEGIKRIGGENFMCGLFCLGKPACQNTTAQLLWCSVGIVINFEMMS